MYQERGCIIVSNDKILECRDCGKEFVLTEGEQAFYKEKGFEEPKRCPSCREARKQNRYEGRKNKYN